MDTERLVSYNLFLAGQIQADNDLFLSIYSYLLVYLQRFYTTPFAPIHRTFEHYNDPSFVSMFKYMVPLLIQFRKINNPPFRSIYRQRFYPLVLPADRVGLSLTIISVYGSRRIIFPLSIFNGLFPFNQNFGKFGNCATCTEYSKSKVIGH